MSAVRSLVQLKIIFAKYITVVVIAKFLFVSFKPSVCGVSSPNCAVCQLLSCLVRACFARSLEHYNTEGLAIDVFMNSENRFAKGKKLKKLMNKNVLLVVLNENL